MLGLTNGDFAGVHSAMVNPANIAGSKYYMDVNLITMNSSFENDLYYATFISNIINNMITGDYSLHDGSYKYGRAYNYFDNEDQKSFYANARIIGPSFIISAGNHAFGMNLSARSVQSSHNIPFEIPIIIYEEIRDERFHMIEFNNYGMQMAGLTWSEIGFNYAYDAVNRYDNKFTVGLGIKAIFGFEATYIDMRNLNYLIVNINTVNVINIDADIGYSLPVDNQTNELNFRPLVRGFGLGTDVGLVYTKKKSSIMLKEERSWCAKPYYDYIFKIGVSLMDLGQVSFTGNADLHRFEHASYYWDQFDTIQFVSFERSLRSYSEVFYGNPDSSLVQKTIKIGLPSMISLQFDYHVSKHFYAAIIWMHPVQLYENTIWRPAQLAVIPRYENKQIGLYLPLSLYDYAKPRLGFAFRFYSFTIGTDNLSTWFGNKGYTGLDIYFSFKVNLEKGRCSTTKKGACYNQDF